MQKQTMELVTNHSEEIKALKETHFNELEEEAVEGRRLGRKDNKSLALEIINSNIRASTKTKSDAIEQQNFFLLNHINNQLSDQRKIKIQILEEM